MQKFNYKITISYDGTHYSGWQIQRNSLTIQEILQEKLAIILRTSVQTIGSGRTDAGVHALGQVANFKHDKEIDLIRFMKSINGLLPNDIRIKKIEKVPMDFHAQHRTLTKEYHYHLHLDHIQNPFKRLYSWHIHDKIDLNIMKEASILFLGTHDFIAFANEAHSGCAAYDSIRTLHRLEMVQEDGGIRLEFEGDGFLYKMVRNIVGTLHEIASNKRPVNDILKIFKSRDRRLGGKAAPPHGLFLKSVKYK